MFLQKSHKINFITSQYYTIRSLRIIMALLETVRNKYSGRSFNIYEYYGDNKFDKATIKELLTPAIMYIYSCFENVGYIEISTHKLRSVPGQLARVYLIDGSQS